MENFIIAVLFQARPWRVLNCVERFREWLIRKSGYLFKRFWGKGICLGQRQICPCWHKRLETDKREICSPQGWAGLRLFFFLRHTQKHRYNELLMKKQERQKR